jgi:hypothetical protein
LNLSCTDTSSLVRAITQLEVALVFAILDALFGRCPSIQILAAFPFRMHKHHDVIFSHPGI